MTTIDYDWSLSNPGPTELIVWLEPWTEEFVVPIKSTLSMKGSGGSDTRGVGHVEWASDRVVVWATAAIVEVYVDYVRQDTASAIVPVPDALSKDMLTLLFAKQPAARLGGAANHDAGRGSWWRRLQRKLRFT